MTADSDTVGGAYGSSCEHVAAHSCSSGVGRNCISVLSSFETAPVTGSLIFVVAYLSLAEFGTLFQDIVDCLARAIRGTQCLLEMATGSGRQVRC